MNVRRLASSCALLLSTRGLSARPEPPEPRISLVWQAPAACPDQARIDVLLADALAGVDAKASEPFSARATVNQEDGGWRAVIDVRYAATWGQRELSATTCDELAATAVVIVSLLASGRDWPALAEVTPATEPIPAPAPPVEPDSSVAPEGLTSLPRDGLPPPLPAALTAAAPDRPGTRFVRALLLAGVGGVTEPRGAVAAAAGVTPDGLGGFAQLEWWPSLAEAQANQDIGLDVDLWSLAVAACVTVTETVRLSLCGGPRVELLHARANVAEPRSDQAVLWAAQASFGATLPLADSWRLAAGLEGSWRLRSAELSVAPHGTVYELRRWGGALLAGVERTF